MPDQTDMQRIFERRADGIDATGMAPVGVFGEGVPRPLIAALGGLSVDVKAPPLSDASDGPQAASVAAVAEPFLDAFTARFLHRFAAGAFDAYATLIFARDDVAGLAAYQYATELRRQGRLPVGGPRLHLWNLLHTDSAAAERFNRSELARLITHLTDTLGGTLDPDRLSDAIAVEACCAQVIEALPRGGPDAFVARNVGRWLTPDAHAALLEGFPPPDAPAEGPKIVLVGSACDIPVLHEICAGPGHVTADLQDYGRSAPTAKTSADLLREIALDPLCIRAAPPGRYTRALRDETEGADLVVASVDPNDDSFGWELPVLRRTVDARGAGFLDLGFRPFRPDVGWQNAARRRIEEALT